MSADDKKQTNKQSKQTTTTQQRQTNMVCPTSIVLRQRPSGFIIYGQSGHQNHLKEHFYPHPLEVSISKLS